MITSAKELRARTKAVLDAVARGQEVIVTYRGRACARIVQPSKNEVTGKRRSDTALFGIWRSNKKNVSVRSQVDKLRQGRF